MDFGICSKSFRHHIVVFHKVGNFIKPLLFLDWQLVANVCKLREKGAKTVFYMTWADKSRPQTQKVIADAYSRIAVELGAVAVLAPVGLAWEKAQALDVKLNLHHSDNRHANPSGAYLAACVFFTVFFNASPERLPATLLIESKIRLDLAEDRAGFLQKIAYETVSSAEVGIRKSE
jgi:hypothetical protein